MFIYSEKAQKTVYGPFEAYQDLFNEERQLEHIFSCKKRNLIRDVDNHCFYGSQFAIQVLPPTEVYIAR